MYLVGSVGMTTAQLSLISFWSVQAFSSYLKSHFSGLDTSKYGHLRATTYLLLDLRL